MTALTLAIQRLNPMKSFSLKLLKCSDRKVRSGFLFPLAFCLLSVAFYIPEHSPLPASAQAIDARLPEGDRLMQQGIQQNQIGQLRAALREHPTFAVSINTQTLVWLS